MIGNDWDEKLNIIWNSEGFKNFYNTCMQYARGVQKEKEI